jgi:glucose-1-phosphate adenylyltransferase
VVTQYKSHSLLRHLQRGWSFLRGEVNEFVDLLPAQQRVDEESWYRGTADAVYQNIDILETYRPSPEYVVILAGDHIYKMNYADAGRPRRERGRVHDCLHRGAAARCQRLRRHGVDDRGIITDFIEKPADPPPMPGNPDVSLCSMGIYIFNAKYLYDELERDINDPSSKPRLRQGHHSTRRDESRCRGASVLPQLCHAAEEAKEKEHYWRDAGTLDAYWEANIDLTATVPALNLYDRNWPVWTYQQQLPPAKFVHNHMDRRGVAIESTVSGGCIISGEVNRSLLFSGCRVHSYARVNLSVLLPDTTVGTRARLSHCVVDAGCSIPAGMVIGEDPEEDARRFRRTEGGISLVTRKMLERLG